MNAKELTEKYKEFDTKLEALEQEVENLKMPKGRDVKRFIDHYRDENVDTQYRAGQVSKDSGNFIIAYEMYGAQDTFSIGQPVYDKDGYLMGYLGIGVFGYLDYSTEGNIRIPVEHWIICLPTKHCIEGKAVYTYWQIMAESKEDVIGASEV